MRIMFAITKGEIGGAQQHVRTLATAFAEDGHDVALLVEESSLLGADIAAAGGEVIPWGSISRDLKPRADLLARRELRAAIGSFKPEILHVHSAKAGLLGRGLGDSGSATIYTCHHAAFGPGRQWSHRILARPAEQLTLQSLDGVISVGARDIPQLRKLAPGVPVRLIRNAVPWTGDPVAPRPPGPHALWVSRMRRPKDPLQAVAAWEQVVKVVPEATLTMCGGGPLADALRRRIAWSPAASSIDYRGEVPSLEEYHRRSSLFILASDVEGGITIATLEAMTQGLVPVVSDAGDAWLHEILGMGVVVPRRSPEVLAQAVVALVNDPMLVDKMRQRAIAYARTAWTTQDMISATIDFYLAVRR